MNVDLTARRNPPAPIDLTARRKSLSSDGLCATWHQRLSAHPTQL